MASDSFSRFVRAVVSEDHLRARLVIEAGMDPSELDPGLVESLLAERGVIASAMIPGAVIQTIDEYRAEPSERLERVVARGTPPEQGHDAAFHLAPDLDHHAESARSGQIDHHARSALMVVRPGQVLGRVVQATPGRDGLDVRGRTLAARPGKPLRPVFDESVRMRQDGVVVSLEPGLLEITPARIRIVRELQLAGCVDFSTGNIDFPGDVAVGKGVRDCFVVRAGRDLRVHGLVEAADLAAGRDAHLSTGMAAREKGSLSVGRDLFANYLTNLETTIGRHATIAKEMANCRVVVGGQLPSPVCAVVGGSVCVALRAEVAQIGAESATPTEFIVGKLPALETQLLELLHVKPRTEQMAERAAARLTELQHATGKLTASQAEELTELEFELAGARTRDAKVGGAIARLAGVIVSRTDPVLVVHRTIFPGTRIWIGSYELEVRELVRGPLEITLAPSGLPRARVPTSHAEIVLASLGRLMQQSRFVDARRYAPEPLSQAA